MNFDNQTLEHDQVQSLRKSSTEWRFWTDLLAGGSCLRRRLDSFGAYLSVFFKPLMQEFHASRAAVSLAFT